MGQAPARVKRVKIHAAGYAEVQSRHHQGLCRSCPPALNGNLARDRQGARHKAKPLADVSEKWHR